MKIFFTHPVLKSHYSVILIRQLAFAVNFSGKSFLTAEEKRSQSRFKTFLSGSKLTQILLLSKNGFRMWKPPKQVKTYFEQFFLQVWYDRSKTR